jgi:hypothetical protein
MPFDSAKNARQGRVLIERRLVPCGFRGRRLNAAQAPSTRRRAGAITTASRTATQYPQDTDDVRNTAKSHQLQLSGGSRSKGTGIESR